MSLYKKINIKKALKCFGGFVRYYDTTEPLSELSVLVSEGHCQDILACCGCGNQALTMLGSSSGKGIVWAVDLNPAQLFVLAAKSFFLKKKNLIPSFEQMRKAYPGRIVALKKNMRPMRQVRLCHIDTGKETFPPAGLADRYALVTDGGMFALPQSGPFWQEDQLFMSRVRLRLNCLRFMNMDIFDSSDYFKKESLDLIYLSDIYFPQALIYYQEKIEKLAGLLRPGGRIISYLDQGDDFMGMGISPGRLLAQNAGKFALKIDKKKAGGYLVLEKFRERR